MVIKDKMSKTTKVKQIINNSFMTEKGVKNNSRSIYQDGSVNKIANGMNHFNSVIGSLLIFTIFRSNL